VQLWAAVAEVWNILVVASVEELVELDRAHISWLSWTGLTVVG
jgi:hypothetical protein